MKRRARYLAHLKATFCLVYVCVIPANKYYNHLRYSWKKIGFCHLQGSLTFISTMIRLSLETNAIISDKRCVLFYLHYILRLWTKAICHYQYIVNTWYQTQWNISIASLESIIILLRFDAFTLSATRTNFFIKLI